MEKEEHCGDHPRLLLHEFINPDLCNELEFIHRSCGTAGYRTGVLSTTLLHLIATNCAHLLLPFLEIRDKIKDLVEDTFDCHFQLFTEFTGLISWCKGASIGWHSDDNRPYLKQRDFAAVCYLNSHGKDFDGGTFHFKHGKPSSVVPVAGDVLIYTADARNIHSVDEVTDGERLTLTFWFTRDSSYNEDAKIISLISQNLPNSDDHEQGQHLIPFPASDNMYWFPHEQMGFDIRSARLHALGFHFCSLSDAECGTSDSSCDVLLLDKPLGIRKGIEVYDKEFSNSLHALQVVQFYYWKAPELSTARRKVGSHISTCNSCTLANRKKSESTLTCNNQLSDLFFRRSLCSDAECSFNWDDFKLASSRWEEYASKLRKDSSASIPFWIAQESVTLIDIL